MESRAERTGEGRPAEAEALRQRMNEGLTEAGVSLMELSRRTGDRYRNVHRWLREGLRIPADFVVRFARAVPVDPAVLLGVGRTGSPVGPSGPLPPPAAGFSSPGVAWAGIAEQVIESSSDGILAFDSSYRYTLWNPAMTRITGLGPEEALGRVAFDLFPFLDTEGERAFFEAALQGRFVVSRNRRFTIPSNDRSGWFEALYAPLRDSDGRVGGGLAIIRDMSDWVQGIDRLRDTEREYRRRLDAIGDPDLRDAIREFAGAKGALAELMSRAVGSGTFSAGSEDPAEAPAQAPPPPFPPDPAAGPAK